jgi:hypothetical protein
VDETPKPIFATARSRAQRDAASSPSPSAASPSAAPPSSPAASPGFAVPAPSDTSHITAYFVDPFARDAGDAGRAPAAPARATAAAKISASGSQSFHGAKRDEIDYEYVDKHGARQGPFSRARMRSWFSKSLLPEGLMVRAVGGAGGGAFVALHEWPRGAGDANPFAANDELIFL